MPPKIGLKTVNIFYEKEDKIPFDTLEITTKDPDLGFNVKKLMKVKEHLKGKDLSMHSQASRIFSCNNFNLEKFNEAEINVVKAEIILCNLLNIQELIIHLKQEKLTKKEEKPFSQLLNFAKKHNVELIYESNKEFFGETCLDVLKKFPKLNYLLDLGHLNTAIGNKTLGFELDEFLSLIKDRIIYIHAHNNNGKKDEHKSLDNGTLNWRHVFDMINMKKVRKIILELKTAQDILKSKKLLKQYFK